MTLQSQEHYELMAQFEKTYKGHGRLDREKSKETWKIGAVYEDGHVNQLFLAFRQGYSYGRAV